MDTKPEGKVIGPFDAADWIMMKEIRWTIDYMKRENIDPVGLKKEQSLYKYFITGQQEAA